MFKIDNSSWPCSDTCKLSKVTIGVSDAGNFMFLPTAVKAASCYSVRFCLFVPSICYCFCCSPKPYRKSLNNEEEKPTNGYNV